MKAVQIYAPLDMRIDEIEKPEIGENQVLLKIAYGGICGSDMSYYSHGASGVAVIKNPPFVPGHEFSGTIAEVGANVNSAFPELEIGQNATVFPAILEGDFEMPARLEGRLNLWPKVRYFGSAALDPHQNGGFTEYLAVNADQIRLLPSSIDLKLGALVEPLSVAVHGVNRAQTHWKRTSDADLKGVNVFVNGAGAIGALIIAVLRHKGANVSAGDVSDSSLKTAQKLGAKKTYRVDKDIIEEKFDIVFDASGVSKATALIFDVLNLGGLVVQIGNLSGDFAEYKLGQLVFKEADYIGSFRFTNEDLLESIDLLNEGLDVKPLISHTFDADDAIKAMETAVDRNIPIGKVLIKFN
jgi:L-idonate 5-dehydrogenase